MKVPTACRVIPALTLAFAALTACGQGGDEAGAGRADSPAAAAPDSSSASTSPSASRERAAGQDPSSDEVSRDRSGGQDAESEAGRDGGAQRCAAGQLRVSVEDQDSAAGTTHFQLAFRNTGTEPCSLTGFPGVSFRGRDGAQIGTPADRASGTPATTVTLIPDARAVADAKALNGQAGLSAGECRLTSVSFLGVFPPGSREQIDVPWKASECAVRGAHGLTVGPLHPVR
ncbi:DUF4232 domain-containing protein [Streptomyces sp. NPDC005722]